MITLSQLVENIEAVPRSASFGVEGPDKNGDVAAIVRDGERSERFWVQDPLLSTLSVATTAPRRVHEVILQIVLQRGPRLSSALDSFHGLLGDTVAATPTPMSPRIELPHVIVDDLHELVANLLAVPGAEFVPRRLDDDGDAVVDLRLGTASGTFWVKGALLAQLSALATAPPDLMSCGPLARASRSRPVSDVIPAV